MYRYDWLLAEQGIERSGVIMDVKGKTKAAHILTGVLTFGIIFTASSVGSLPAAKCEAYHVQEADKKERKNEQAQNYDDGQKDQVHLEKYAACGIKKKDGSYYYKGERVKVIKDQGPDSAVYKFDPERKGAVSIKVIRDKKGRIKRVVYLTEKEAARLIKRAGLKETDA